MLVKLVERLTTIGKDKFDSPEIRLQKVFLIYLSLLMSAGGILWGVLAAVFGMYEQAVIPLAYTFLTMLNLLYFSSSKKFGVVRNFQTFISLLLPFVFQFFLGGFEISGAVMLWAILSLVASLSFQSIKSSLYWLGLFVISTIAIGVSDNYSKQFIPEQISGLSIYFLVINIIMVSAIVYFLVTYFIRKQQETQNLLNEKNLQIEIQNKEIKDSIIYAKRIQEAILPKENLIEKNFSESFILYKPKDIVAGDFYWMEKDTALDKNTIYFAVADCTGHGVPGAMVSVVCHNALNSAVREHHLTEPGKVLDKVTDIVSAQFDDSKNKVKDGMDIAFCSYNTKTKELFYSGANIPLYIIRNNEILETKATRQPVGIQDNRTAFETHKTVLKENDLLYIFSDGYADQFGGAKGKKFKVKAFRELLLSMKEKTLEEQSRLINSVFENWKGNMEQIDDVCVLGLRV